MIMIIIVNGKEVKVSKDTTEVHIDFITQRGNPQVIVKRISIAIQDIEVEEVIL